MMRVKFVPEVRCLSWPGRDIRPDAEHCAVLSEEDVNEIKARWPDVILEMEEVEPPVRRGRRHAEEV